MARAGITLLFHTFDNYKKCIHFPEGDGEIFGTQTACTSHC